MMKNKYPTSYELQQVLNNPSVTRLSLNQFAQRKGIFLLNASKEELIEELSGYLYEYNELEEIRQIAYQSTNKQILTGFTIKPETKDFDLEHLYDKLREKGEFNKKGYKLKSLTRKQQGESVSYKGEIEYIKNKIGRIAFLQGEVFTTEFYFHKLENNNWQVEVDGSCSSDGKEVLNVIKKAINSESAEIDTLEVSNLKSENVIEFFDKLAHEGLDDKVWQISDIKQLTFKKRKEAVSELEEDETEEETVSDKDLGGISQAMLEGRNLREHSFVKQAEMGGCIFTAMTYEFQNIKDSTWITIKAEFKGSPKIFEVSVISTATSEGAKKKKQFYSSSLEYRRGMSSVFWNNAKNIYLELL